MNCVNCATDDNYYVHHDNSSKFSVCDVEIQSSIAAGVFSLNSAMALHHLNNRRFGCRMNVHLEQRLKVVYSNKMISGIILL